MLITSNSSTATASTANSQKASGNVSNISQKPGNLISAGNSTNGTSIKSLIGKPFLKSNSVAQQVSSIPVQKNNQTSSAASLSSQLPSKQTKTGTGFLGFIKKTFASTPSKDKTTKEPEPENDTEVEVQESQEGFTAVPTPQEVSVIQTPAFSSTAIESYKPAATTASVSVLQVKIKLCILS